MDIKRFNHLLDEFMDNDNPVALLNYGESLRNYAEDQENEEEAESLKRQAFFIIGWANEIIENYIAKNKK